MKPIFTRDLKYKHFFQEKTSPQSRVTEHKYSKRLDGEMRVSMHLIFFIKSDFVELQQKITQVIKNLDICCST